MYGVETSEEKNADLLEFRKKIETKDRWSQYSWDCALLFHAGDPAKIVPIPKAHIAVAMPDKKNRSGGGIFL
jgi:hypothetical protein